MLVLPYIRLLLLGLLVTFVPLVGAKGGGGHGGGRSRGGKSSSSKGGSSKSKPKITKTVVHTNGSSHTECRDAETQAIVKCPKDSKKAGIIAGAVIGSVLGLLLIAGLVFWFMRRRRQNKGQTATRSLTIPFIAPAKKKEYKPIDSDSELPKVKDENTV